MKKPAGEGGLDGVNFFGRVDGDITQSLSDARSAWLKY